MEMIAASQSKRDSLAKEAYDEQNLTSKPYGELTAKEKEPWEAVAKEMIIFSYNKVDKESGKEPKGEPI